MYVRAGDSEPATREEEREERRERRGEKRASMGARSVPFTRIGIGGHTTDEEETRPESEKGEGGREEPTC